MAKFFISYSRVDKAFTKPFVERLQQAFPKHEFWYDDKLTGSDRWWSDTLKHVSEADIFIYLLSKESVTAPYCQAEFHEAKRLRKLILPVQVRDQTKVTSTLNPIQTVNMTAGVNSVSAQADLIRAVTLKIAAIPKRRSRPVSTTPTPKPELRPESPRPSNAPAVTTQELQISVDSAEERTRTVPVRVGVSPVPLPRKGGGARIFRALILVAVVIFAVWFLSSYLPTASF